MVHISLKSEPIFAILGFTVTNSILFTEVLLILFTIFAVIFAYKMKNDKNSFFVFLVRFIVKAIYDLFETLLKDKSMVFFPLIGAFFFFILLSNWSGLIPGIGSVLIKSSYVAEKVPLFRAPTSDLNTTFALALISIILVQWYGFKYLGFKYTSRYINFKNPIQFALGLLEIISELSRILSFAFRLFGNIFAGEVLLVIIASLIPVLASFPFLMLELFVGLIQALVFAMLTAVFISSAISHESH